MSDKTPFEKWLQEFPMRKALLRDFPKSSVGYSWFAAAFKVGQASGIEAAAQVARNSYACYCEEGWTSRNMHSPDCFGQLMQEAAEDILALKKEP